MEQLRIILGNTPACQSGTSPYPELDALYDLILSANPDHEELLPILAAILVLPDNAKSPACIELVLGLPAGQVALTLRAMHSVLDIGNREDAIELYHASFQDYLTNEARSCCCHIDMTTWTDDIARRWLQNLTTSKMQTYSFNQLYDNETYPFFIEWVKFCSEWIYEPPQELLDDLWNVDIAFPKFLQKTFKRHRRESWDSLKRSLVSWVKRYTALIEPQNHPTASSSTSPPRQTRRRWMLTVYKGRLETKALAPLEVNRRWRCNLTGQPQKEQCGEVYVVLHSFILKAEGGDSPGTGMCDRLVSVNR
ncbi:hypothetical protein PM082_011239 [Marasmius tenuissimus]|nr:hypothetical protein PM082_011239 [Marasmius tenuissimus]